MGSSFWRFEKGKKTSLGRGLKTTLLAVLVVAAATSLIVVLAWKNRTLPGDFDAAAAALPAELARSKSLGVPLEFDALRNGAAGGANAATDYRRLSEQYSALPEQRRREVRQLFDAFLTQGSNTPVLASALKDLEPLRQTASKAAEKEACYFQQDYSNPEYVGKHREAMIVTAASSACSAVLKARQGDREAAERALRLAVRMGQHLATDPDVDALVAALEVEHRVIDALVLIASTSTPNNVEAARAILTGLPPLPDLRHALREQAVVAATAADSAGEEHHADDGHDEDHPGHSHGHDHGNPGLISTILEKIDSTDRRMARAFKSRNLQFYNSLFEGLATTQSAIEQHAVVRDLRTKHLMTEDVSANLLKVLQPRIPSHALAQAQARRAMLDAFLKVFEAREASGRLPQSIETPDDPFTGKPLIYQRNAEGFVISSSGVDEADLALLENPNPERYKLFMRWRPQMWTY